MHISNVFELVGLDCYNEISADKLCTLGLAYLTPRIRGQRRKGTRIASMFGMQAFCACSLRTYCTVNGFGNLVDLLVGMKRLGSWLWRFLETIHRY